MNLTLSSREERDSPGSTLSQLMTASRKATPRDVRVNNRMMIFSQLFPKASLSRAGIGRLTGLSKASVSEVVSDLHSNHILEEVGRETQNRRGKKGTLLRVDTAHWNIISVDLSQPYLIQGAIITITGAILERTEMSMEQPTDITTCKVVELCRLLMAKAAGEILGFGIAVPGIVNGAGVVLKSTTLGWNKVHLKSIIEKEFNKPAVIDHDAHSALLAERYFGKGTPNTLFIQLTLGVGASLLIEDSTVLGVNHHAGEIGHVTVNGNGPQCICGKRGCLESLVSLSAIRSRLSQPGSDRLEVLTQSGQYLGQALAFPVNLLDIDDIVVYGPPDIVGPQFLHSVKRTLIEYGSTNSPHHYCVRRCECGSDIVMLGESISVLQLTLANL